MAKGGRKVGEARVDITADASQLNAELAKSKRNVEGFANDATGGAFKVARSITSLVGKVGALAAAIGAVVTSINYMYETFSQGGRRRAAMKSLEETKLALEDLQRAAVDAQAKMNLEDTVAGTEEYLRAQRQIIQNEYARKRAAADRAYQESIKDADGFGSEKQQREYYDTLRELDAARDRTLERAARANARAAQERAAKEEEAYLELAERLREEGEKDHDESIRQAQERLSIEERIAQVRIRGIIDAAREYDALIARQTAGFGVGSVAGTSGANFQRLINEVRAVRGSIGGTR